MKQKMHTKVLKKVLALTVAFAMLFMATPMLSMADSGTPAQDVEVKVTDVTDTTAKVTITNNQTYMYPSGYCLVKKANEQAPTAEEVKGQDQDNQVADPDFVQGKKKEISKELENLNPGTEYTVYAIVYYGEKHNTPEAYSSVVSATFKTTGESTTPAQDVEVKVTDVTDTTAKIEIINKGAKNDRPGAKYLIKKKSELAPDAMTVFKSGETVLEPEFMSGTKTTISTTIDDLSPNTEYIAYAIIVHIDKMQSEEEEEDGDKKIAKALSSVASVAFTTEKAEAEPEGDILQLTYKKGEQLTTEKFKNYSEAFAKLNALNDSVSNVKVTLLANVKTKDPDTDWTGSVNIRRSCTLDLAGKRIEMPVKERKYGIYITGENTTLTIDDSSENKSGEIRATIGAGDPICVGSNSNKASEEDKTGNLVLKNGKISSEFAKYDWLISGAKKSSIDVKGGLIAGAVFTYGKFNMSGGTIKFNSKAPMLALQGESPANISGGIISNELEEDIIPGITCAISVSRVIMPKNNEKNLNITGGVISTKKVPTVIIASGANGKNDKPIVSLAENAELISEEASTIQVVDVHGSNDFSEPLKLDIAGDVKLEGKRILDIVKNDTSFEAVEGETKHLELSIADSVKLKYSDSIPFLPNSSYIKYTDGKVLNTKKDTDDYYSFVTAKDVKQKITIAGAEQEWGYQYLEELEREIQGAKSIYDTQNSGGKYNSDLWTAFKKAYEAALPIPKDINANQNEINYFKNELGRTRTDMTNAAENSVDVSKLADGTYDVDIDMRLWAQAGFSMANEAVEHTARLTVVGGKGKLTIQMKPISILNLWGSLMQLWVFDGENPAEAYANSAESEKGQKTEAKYLKWHSASMSGGAVTPIDGTPSEAPTLENSIRPKTLELILPYMGANSDYNKIYCYVAVDMMRALAKGPAGDQPVILYIKYSTLKPVEVKPNLVTEVDALTIQKNKSKDIKINLAGSGDMTGWSISVASEKPDVATATFNAGKVTVSGLKAGETNIVVTATKTGETDIVKKIHIKVSESVDLVKATTIVSGKTATTEIDGEVMADEGGENVKAENGKIVINAEPSEGKNVEDVSVNLSKKALDAISTENKAVLIKTCIGDMEFNAKAIEHIDKAGDDLTINLKKTKNGKTVIENAISIDFKISTKKGGDEVKLGNGGKVQISMQIKGIRKDGVIHAYEIKNNKKVDKIWTIRSNDTFKWNVKHSGTWELSEQALFDIGENTKPENPGTPEVKPETQNGTWSVPIYVKNLATGKDSMANGAFSSYALAEVTDTAVTYTITLQGMRLQGLKGHLLNLWYYTDYRNKVKEEAVYTRYNDTGLQEGKVESFPHTAKFTMKGKPQDEVYIRVNVDAMNEAAIGAGQQDALLMFNWKNATRGSDKANSSMSKMDKGTVVEKPAEEKPLTPEELKKQEAKADEVLAKANITDVSNHWAKKSIAYVIEKNLFKGASTTVKDGVTVTNFEPESNMTRSMVVAVLHRLAGTPAAGKTNMSDVEAGTWYENAVNWAVASKIVTGVGEHSFAPNQPITREAFVTMMYNYAKANDPKMNKTGDIGKFKDAAGVSNWSKDAISWAVGMGLLSGNDKGELSPAKTITRAEVASIFERYLKASEAQKAKDEKAKTDKKS